MIRTSEKLDKIAPALLKVQQALEAIEKTGNNPHYGNSFATVNDVLDAVKEPCHKNGIAILQMPSNREYITNESVVMLQLTTRLQHVSGQFIESTAEIPLGKTDPQGFGSALTYGRRYSLQAALGLQAEDDDGEAAVTHAAPINKANANTPPRKSGSLFPRK